MNKFNPRGLRRPRDGSGGGFGRFGGKRMGQNFVICRVGQGPGRGFGRGHGHGLGRNRA